MVFSNEFPQHAYSNNVQTFAMVRGCEGDYAKKDKMIIFVNRKVRGKFTYRGATERKTKLWNELCQFLS